MYEDSSSSASKEPTIVDFEQLYLIHEKDRQVIFEENLHLVDADGHLLQEVTIAVEDSDQTKDGFAVYQYTRDDDRVLRVQSHVRRDLSTKTEVRQIKKMDRTAVLRVTHRDDWYEVFRLVLDGSAGWREKTELDQSVADRLLLEGANILVLRKVAMSKLLGQFSGQTVDHEGRLCICEYEVEAGENGQVVVRRTVFDAEGGQEVLTTILTAAGRIKQHQWAGSDWRLVSSDTRLSPEVTDHVLRGEEEEEEEEEVPMEEELEADQETYFDKKEILIELMKLYLLDHTDVQDMIADFMKNLLYEKPDDVVDYADKFFSEFVGIPRMPVPRDNVLEEVHVPEDVPVIEESQMPSSRSNDGANTFCSSNVSDVNL